MRPIGPRILGLIISGTLLTALPHPGPAEAATTRGTSALSVVKPTYLSGEFATTAMIVSISSKRVQLRFPDTGDRVGPEWTLNPRYPNARFRLNQRDGKTPPC